MSEHTKSPLFADGPEVMAEDYFAHLATCWNNDKVSPEEAEEHARIFAAAPDLLAALEEVDAWVEKMPEAMRQRVRLAIGKARGEGRS